MDTFVLSFVFDFVELAFFSLTSVLVDGVDVESVDFFKSFPHSKIDKPLAFLSLIH